MGADARAARRRRQPSSALLALLQRVTGGGVEEHESGDPLGKLAGEQLRRQSSHRCRDDHERSTQPDTILKDSQVACLVANRDGARRRIAPADAAAIVAAHGRARGDALAYAGGAERVLEARAFEDDGRVPLAAAQEVQPSASDVDEGARRRELEHRRAVGVGFVDQPADGDRDENGDPRQRDGAPRAEDPAWHARPEARPVLAVRPRQPGLLEEHDADMKRRKEDEAVDQNGARPEAGSPAEDDEPD